MGRRTRSRTWSTSAEQALDSNVASSLTPPPLASRNERTPTGQAWRKRTRRPSYKGNAVAAKEVISLNTASEDAMKQSVPKPTAHLDEQEEVALAAASEEAILSLPLVPRPSAKKQDSSWERQFSLSSSPAKPVRSQTVYDVVANNEAELELLPLGAKKGEGRITVGELHQDDSVLIRVFRFFEDKDHEAHPWEEKLKNVNSGSLLWLLVHVLPKMHSVRGCKYGKWFTTHTVRVQARHFASAYHMCNEGCAGQAKTFGTSPANKSLVTGEKLPSGYFWFVSPTHWEAEASAKDTAHDDHLEAKGWQHIRREGPFNAEDFVEEWHRQDSPMDEESLQKIVRNCML